MNTVVQTVHAATIGMQGAMPIAAPVRVAFSVCNTVYQFYRMYNKADIYSNPDNFYKLMTGHALHFVAGNSEALRVVAQCAAISKRILGCIAQQGKVVNAYENWWNAMAGNYPKYRQVNFQNSGSSVLYSSSTAKWMAAKWQVVSERVRHIAIATINFCWELLHLSMRLMDTVEAFSVSPMKHHENISELFINAGDTIDGVVDLQKAILKTLQDNEKMVAQVLKGIGSSYTVEQVIGVAKTFLKAGEVVQDIGNAAGEVAKDFGSRVIYGAAQIFGAEEHIPESLRPPSTPKWMSERSSEPVRQQFFMSRDAREKHAAYKKRRQAEAEQRRELGISLTQFT